MPVFFRNASILAHRQVETFVSDNVGGESIMVIMTGSVPNVHTRMMVATK